MVWTCISLVISYPASLLSMAMTKYLKGFKQGEIYFGLQLQQFLYVVPLLHFNDLWSYKAEYHSGEYI